MRWSGFELPSATGVHLALNTSLRDTTPCHESRFSSAFSEMLPHLVVLFSICDGVGPQALINSGSSPSSTAPSNDLSLAYDFGNVGNI